MDVKKLNQLNRIRLVRRLVPVVAERPQWPMAAGPQAMHLAERVLSRYAAAAGPIRPGELFYRLAPVPPSSGSARVVRQVTQRHTVQLGLRLSLTLLHWSHPAAERVELVATGPVVGPVPAHPPQIGLRPAVVRPVAQPLANAWRPMHEAGQSAARQEPAVEEIVRVAREQGGAQLVIHPVGALALAHRAERVSMVGSTPLSGGELVMPPLGGAAPVPRTVLRRETSEANAVQEKPPVPGAGHSSVPTPIPWPGEASGDIRPGLDRVQLNHLADQVVQVIDDRIIARRERMGRV